MKGTVRTDLSKKSRSTLAAAYPLELCRAYAQHAPRPGAELSLRIEQGHELGRPSLVLLRAGQAGAVPDIRVGGRVFPILRGELG